MTENELSFGMCLILMLLTYTLQTPLIVFITDAMKFGSL